jgi:hypothetical protein
MPRHDSDRVLQLREGLVMFAKENGATTKDLAEAFKLTTRRVRQITRENSMRMTDKELEESAIIRPNVTKLRKANERDEERQRRQAIRLLKKGLSVARVVSSVYCGEPPFSFLGLAAPPPVPVRDVRRERATKKVEEMLAQLESEENHGTDA